MGCGPLVGAVGVALMLRLDADVDYWTDLFPALLLFSLGLTATVAPLTATVLADADEHNAGIASGVNNAIARIANLLCVAGLGAVVAAVYANELGPRRVGRRRADRHPRRARVRRGVRPGLPRRASACARRCSRSAASSGWPGSATRAARSAARTAPRARSRCTRRSRASRSRRRAEVGGQPPARRTVARLSRGSGRAGSCTPWTLTPLRPASTSSPRAATS